MKLIEIHKDCESIIYEKYGFDLSIGWIIFGLFYYEMIEIEDYNDNG
jgi:hypothetical protein